MAASHSEYASAADVPTEALGIQLVAFDWPWPPNYGGAIDVAYRLRAFLRAGVRVHLHVIGDASRQGPLPTDWPQERLLVFHYTRRGWRSALSRKPYIVNSRKTGKLLPNLASGPPVILFEGTHTTAYLGHPRLANHTQWLRLHNREAVYYARLGQERSASLAKRLYYLEEARRLRAYESKILAEADLVLPITSRDAGSATGLPEERVLVQPPYVDFPGPFPRAGAGTYALYHGAFDVADNVAAAKRLMTSFAERPNLRLVLAGRRPPRRFIEHAAQQGNVTLVQDPGSAEMRELITDAQAVLMQSNNRAGFKVKLLTSIGAARHVVADAASVYGAPELSRLAQAAGVLTVCETAADWDRALDHLPDRQLSEQQAAQRVELLRPYAPGGLVMQLIDLLKYDTFNRN